MMVFSKFTTRPCASVMRPSSRICSRMFSTSGCAFSISSNRMTAVGLAADLLGQLSGLVIADIAGRRADELGDGVLLHILGHIQPDQAVGRVKQVGGQLLDQLRLAHAGGADEDEATRACCLGEMPTRLRRMARGHGVHGLVLPDDVLLQARRSSSLRRLYSCLAGSWLAGIFVHSSMTRARLSIVSSGLPALFQFLDLRPEAASAYCELSARRSIVLILRVLRLEQLAAPCS